MVDRAPFLSPDGVTFDGKRAVPNEAVTKLMLELADLKSGEKVLEIGTGSGYQTQALWDATHCYEHQTVYTIDREQPASEVLTRHNFCTGMLALQGVSLNYGDGRDGLSHHAPFDCLFVTCGMTSIPPAYEEQLRECGRLIIPLGQPDGQELLRLEKRNGKLVMGRVGGYVRFQMAI